jgi:hypothetical protein
MSTPSVHRRLALFLPLMASAACVRASTSGVSVSVPLPAGVVMEAREIERPPLERSGVIPPADMPALAPRVHHLRAEPAELSVQRGDTLRMSDLLRVLAVDSTGTVLGELPYSDYGYEGRSVFLLRDGRVTFTRAGALTYTVQWPESVWPGRASRRPTVRVPIRVLE